MQQLKTSHVYSQKLMPYQRKYFRFSLEADSNYTLSLEGVNNSTGGVLLYGALAEDSLSLPLSIDPALLLQ